MPRVIDVNNTIQQMASQISSADTEDPIIVGIYTGGVWIAERLHRILGVAEPMGTLDISFYRDDFSRVGLNPEVRSSQLPVSVEDRNIILIDDVLYTGRTIRAALNEIFSYGRPASVSLGVLIDRTGRELPIQPDFVGEHMQLKSGQQAKLSKSGDDIVLNVVDAMAGS
jgi:pyrimidine operon attenuation protein/uracil phosphoribosyltransferase